MDDLVMTKSATILGQTCWERRRTLHLQRQKIFSLASMYVHFHRNQL